MDTSQDVDTSAANMEPNGDRPISTQKKIDRITALQESIDSLSLAMFEALRGLRDAVAPESGNLGASANPNGTNGSNANKSEATSEPIFEDFLNAYKSGDPKTLALVQKHRLATAGKGKTESASLPPKREELFRIHAKVETEKDVELVRRLASTVLEKSDDINERVSELPGMNRTRGEQMSYIEELLQSNKAAVESLEEAHALALERREQVRSFIRANTCAALGIAEEAE